MPSGGPRQPANPAAVSTPGSGRRTDGGAGSKKQPLRLPSGGAYGARKAATEQQQGAPMAAGQPAPSGMGASGGGPGAPSPQGGAFGPTQRPNESNSQVANLQIQNPLAANPQAALRAMYGRYPHPAIKRLIDWSAYGSRPPR